MPGLWYRTFRDFFSDRRLWLFPLSAGLCWFATLTVLLLRWLALGRPRYPGQVNPYVPFISDIAAQTFQPVFIVGCAATGVCFFGTVFAVHHVRYSPAFYGLADDAPTSRTTTETSPSPRTGTVTGTPAAPGAEPCGTVPARRRSR